MNRNGPRKTQPSPMETGRAMQMMRWRMKMTQRQFGELLGVTKATICCWERGSMSKVARRMIELQLENERLKAALGAAACIK